MKTPGFVILILLFTACSDSKDSAEKHIEKKLEKKVREIVVPQGENKGIAKLTIEGMSCEVNCANKIQETISNLSGVLSCTVDFENKLANVEFDPLKIKDEDLIAAVENLNDHQYSVKKMEVEITKVQPEGR